MSLRYAIAWGAAIAALALGCGPSSAAAQQGPPPSDEAAQSLRERCPKLSDAAESLAALAELFDRTQGGENYLPVQVAAAAAEMRTYLSLARRPEVRGISLVPYGPGARSPDAVIRVLGADGVQRDMRVEVKTATGRRAGIQFRAGGGRHVASRPAAARDIARALRSGYKTSAARPSQLVVPLHVDGRAIAPGGKLIVHLPRGTSSPTAVTDAMRGASRGLSGASHVHEVEFFRFDPKTRRTTI